VTAREIFSTPAAMFATPMLDVERAKRLYLAQFVHVGCGGAPVAYVNEFIGCTCCRLLIPAGKRLGETLAKSKEFQSMVVA
jgi:hypothetical protein